MKIVHAASEIFPYLKTGGLADVTAALSKYLAGFGHEVSFFLPAYRKLLDSEEFKAAKLELVIQVELGDEYLRSEVYSLPMGKRQTLYLIRRDEFFDRSYPYGVNGRDYDDNDQRFIYFSKAIVEAMNALGFRADVFHCHDWQVGLAPLFLRMKEQKFGISLALKTFFSIHNLAFQGVFPRKSFALTNLPAEFNGLEGIEFFQQISLIKGGIFFADKILTVSPNYAAEILTPRFGCGMDGALKVRADDLKGIANGIDMDIWNPEVDPVLPSHYTAADLSGKAHCRKALLDRMDMPDTDRPVYGMVCRLTEQKGLDLLVKQLNFFVKNNCRLIILGTGEAVYERALKRWAKANPRQIGVALALDEPMSHLVEAGADFFLMPSVFEPCGLNQMYSQVYGTVPIVSRVGGLVDTVTNFDEDNPNGTGIVFDPSANELKAALKRSLALYDDKASLDRVRKSAMARNFSWKHVARQYEELYSETI